MKKLLIATLCATAFTLTACDKKPTEANGTTAAAVSLSQNVTADIKADLAAIESLSQTKAQEAMEFQSKLLEAAQKNDKAAVDGVLKGMKDAVESFNNDLKGLSLKSSEVDAVRNKMTETNKISVELTEAGMQAQPDQNKIMELSKKSNELQQQLMADMKELQAKVAEAK